MERPGKNTVRRETSAAGGRNAGDCKSRRSCYVAGAVGTLMGEYRVNISFMNVGRHEKRGTALMVLALDETLTPEQIARVKEIPDILGVKLARL